MAEGAAEITQVPVLEPPKIRWPQRLKSSFSLNQNGKEQKTITPEISVDIFFSPHITSADLKGLKERVMQSDIYMPELIGWNQKDVDLFNAVSQGTVKPEDAVGEGLARDVFLGLFDAIYDSHKPIVFVDVPFDSPLSKKKSERLGGLRVVYKDFDENLKNIRKVLITNANRQKQREEHIVSQIRPRVEEIIKIHPELRSKKKLIILLSLGSGHNPLYSRLREEGISLEEISTKSVANGEISLFDEAYLQCVSGKPLNRDVLAKIFLENLFVYAGVLDKSKFKDTKKIYLLTRKLFSESNIEYAKEVFQRSKNGEALRSIFEEKFGPIPRNEKELDGFLAKELSPANA